MDWVLGICNSLTEKRGFKKKRSLKQKLETETTQKRETKLETKQKRN